MSDADGLLTPKKQNFCVISNFECKYRRRGKPGPAKKRVEEDDEKSDSGVSGSAPRVSEPELPLDDVKETTPTPVPEEVRPLDLVNLMDVIVNPQPAPTPFPLIPELTSYLIKTYLTRLYLSNPQTIKSELLLELASPDETPDYYVASLALWAARWDPDLVIFAGNESNRASLFQNLYQRLTITMMPALDFVLAGYDNVRLEATKRSYRRHAIRILISLYHLAGIAMAYPESVGEPLRNSRTIFNLARLVVRAARLREERLYGIRAHLENTPAAGKWRGPYFSPLIERFRRIWWSYAVLDYYTATMYGTDPVIPFEEYQGTEVHVWDDNYSVIKSVAWSPIYSNGIAEDGLVEMGLAISSDDDDSSAETTEPDLIGPRPDTPPTDAAADDIMLTAPLRSATVNGHHHGFLSYIRLAQLAHLVTKYRTFVPNSYVDRPGHLHLDAQIRHCRSEMPGFLVDDIPAKLHALGDTLGSERAILALNGAYFVLQYHAIMCLLSSPSEEVIWKSAVDENWVNSPALVRAQEHAIRATEILIPLVTSSSTPPQMCLSFFQWCTVRTGLVHHAFILAAERGGLGNHELVATARLHIAVHAAALRKAQGGIGADRKSWWYEAFTALTGI